MYKDYESPSFSSGTLKQSKFGSTLENRNPRGTRPFLRLEIYMCTTVFRSKVVEGLHQDLHLCKMFRVKQVYIAFLFFYPYIEK